MRFRGFSPTGPRATSVSAPRGDGSRPRSVHAPARRMHGTPDLHPLATRSAESRCRERHTDHLRASYPARTLAAEPGRPNGTTPARKFRNNVSSSVR
ncbi:hypothetical protein DMA10_02605 [Streptomyces sp. WAC 01420]|nr:hypothetical protein DLM49_29195 [Streptomyces sp. WAC 01438]RSN00529.1 hypothetical protein DMA10_02605 [Streptomyces sp. WAC 01420]